MPGHSLDPGPAKNLHSFTVGALACLGKVAREMKSFLGVIEIYDGLVRWMGWALGECYLDGVGVGV